MATTLDIPLDAEDRWDSAVFGSDPVDGTQTNSELMDEWMANTRQILAGMVHGLQGDPHATPDDLERWTAEYDILSEAEDGVRQALRAAAYEVFEKITASRLDAGYDRP